MDARRLRADALRRLAATLGLALATHASAATPAADPATPDPVEFFYAESNEGGSSGGHVALRLGGDVFHYQQRDGWLRLRREDLRDFVFEYALAGNRPVHALRLELAPDAVARLRSRFETRLRAEASQWRRLRALRDDRARLAAALRHADGAAMSPDGAEPLLVPDAGFFFAAAPADPAARLPADPTWLALRARIEARHGAGYLDARSAEVDAARAGVVPSVLPPLGPVGIETELPLADSYAARAADLDAARTALEALHDAPPLRPGSSFRLRGAPLDPGERAVLCAARKSLSDELADLVASARPDWGTAFLLGAARLLALEASCARGEWIVLDAFAGGRFPEVPAPRPGALAALERDAQASLAAARTRLAGEWSTRRLADVEDLANLARELRRAGRVGRLRLPDDRLVPARPAPRLDAPPAPISREALAGLLRQADERQRSAERALASLHAYHLASRNCVSELFATLETELGDAARPRGWVFGWTPARVVPFLAAAALSGRSDGERVIPSLHGERRAELLAADTRAGAWLRELSPLSARSYAPAAADSRFVLFTDATLPLRPLFGAANLVAGVATAVVGAARAPWDRGALLASGLRGAFWSLPELAFVGVRKGSNEYVAPEWVAWAEAQGESAAGAGTPRRQ